jgi:hypothetical protein
MIRETQASWQARRGSAIPLTDTEQQQLRSVIVSKYNEHFDIINGTTAK